MHIITFKRPDSIITNTKIYPASDFRKVWDIIAELTLQGITFRHIFEE